MALIQPKPFLDNFKLRKTAHGTERRRNMSKLILEDSTYFPKPITYEDIDKAFFDWVDKTLDISYDGKRLPTYRLFSNQKISEYSQTWENLDDTGNIIMNFKTITRENNPQHGESQGESYNIPGHRDYPMFVVPVLQENGEEAYDLYTMKQPFAINFVYTVNLVVNKYELLNKFNEMINYEFQSLQCYIAPNCHAMPMMLDSINDESEYTVDDRKFYSQTYAIKVLGYIIRKEDYKVHRVPSRFIVRFLGAEDVDIWKKDGFKKSAKYKRNSANDLGEVQVGNDSIFRKGTNDLVSIDCEVGLDHIVDPKKPRPTVVYTEEDLDRSCCIQGEDNHYYNKSLEYEIQIPDCESSVTFTMESEMVLNEISTDNVYDFTIYINQEFTDLEGDVRFYEGDSVKVMITRDDLFKSSSLTLKGYDPNVFFDDRVNPESELDVTPDGEKIVVDGNDEEDNGSGETTSND